MGVVFEERDVRARREWLEELLALGSRSTPTTVVQSGEGREVVVGFDRARLSSLLQV